MRGIRALCRCRSPLWAASRLLVSRSDAAARRSKRESTLAEAGRPAGIDQTARGGAPVGGRGSNPICRIEPAKTSYHGGVRKKTVVLWIAAVMGVERLFRAGSAARAAARLGEWEILR